MDSGFGRSTARAWRALSCALLPPPRVLALLALLAGIGPLLAGCSWIRLPAIDPSGDRVFLPHPNSTTLESCAPKPAFTPPPKPAPCAAAELGTGVAAAQPPTGLANGTLCATGGAAKDGGRGQLKLMPARLVAPVGSEVVFLSGYCDDSGFYETRKPIEWVLTPDSVGHFVTVGDISPSYVHRLWEEKACKVTANYAVGWTSSKAHVLGRGTPNPQDDVRVSKGQSWISVTSPTEGTSHVTAWAPEATSWERRRQTAIVQWIDAQWSWPTPSVGRAGEPQVLTTVVTRATNGSPIAGWLVRYVVTGGIGARFANGQSEVEVPTDSSGRAAVEVMPPAEGGGGTAQIAVEVVRPASGSGEIPRSVVGQGNTSATWSAPGLSVHVTGPEAIPLNATATFRITIHNQGDMTTRDVALSDLIPPTLKYVGSNPPGQLFADHLEWRLGDIPARAAISIDVTLQGVRPGDARYCVRATSGEGLSAEHCVERLQVYSPALAINVTGPDTAVVGGDVNYRIDVTNQSNVALQNVRLIDRFDPGLALPDGQASPIYVTIGNLAPGETQTRELAFVVRQPGQQCHTIEAVADGGHATSTRVCLTASPPQPGAATGGALRVQLTGTPRAAVNGEANFTISVLNLGNNPLANVQVVFDYEPTIPAVRSTPVNDVAPGRLIWVIPQLMPNERREFKVVSNCVQADPAAITRVTATTGAGAAQSAEFSTQIGEATTIPMGLGTSGGGSTVPDGAAGDSPVNNGAITGQLTVSVASTTNPARVGEVVVFVVWVKNDRNVTDRDLTLTLEFPPGIDPQRARVVGPTASRALAADGRTLQMEPVAEARAGEALRAYRVELTPTQAGKLVLRAFVKSWRTPTPVSGEAECTVFAQ